MTNDTDEKADPPPAARRRKRRAMVAAVLLAVLAAVAARLWWAAAQPLSAEEQHLVGAWSYQWAGCPGDLGLEYEFRDVRTCLIRSRDLNSGAARGEPTAARWWLSGGTLTVRHPGAAAATYWRLLPSQRAADEVFVLAPDGPDGFRYQGAIQVDSVPTGPPVTGTMSRLRPAE